MPTRAKASGRVGDGERRRPTGTEAATAAAAEVLADGGHAEWYRDAVVYNLDIKTFRDSDGDGWGDIRRLIDRLDYLQDLGVDCLWIRPFYPSPLRDNGYDVADYRVADGGVAVTLAGSGYLWLRGETRGGGR
jgi:maltose alpha-D-glucosyltransferase/alpha-amylase